MKKFALILVFVLTAFGCSAPKTETPVENTATTANTTTNAANTQSEPSSENPVFTGGVKPTDDVISSTKKQLELKAWSLRVESQTNPEANWVMDYVAPNRYHLKKSEGEAIVIGSDSYAKRNGDWQKLDIDLSDQLSEEMKLLTEQSLQDIRNVEKIGTETINGKETIVYRYKNEADEAGAESTTKVWITKDGGLPVRIDFEGAVNGQMQKISTFYDYDKPIKIEAPKVN